MSQTISKRRLPQAYLRGMPTYVSKAEADRSGREEEARYWRGYIKETSIGFKTSRKHEASQLVETGEGAKKVERTLFKCSNWTGGRVLFRIQQACHDSGEHQGSVTGSDWPDSFYDDTRCVCTSHACKILESPSRDQGVSLRSSAFT